MVFPPRPLLLALLGFIVVVTLTSLLGVFAISQQRIHDQALLQQVRSHLLLTRDSLSQAQRQVQELQQFIEHHQHLAQQLRSQVQSNHQAHRQQTSAEVVERDVFYHRYQQQETQRRALQQEAQRFSYE